MADLVFRFKRLVLIRGFDYFSVSSEPSVANFSIWFSSCPIDFSQGMLRVFVAVNYSSGKFTAANEPWCFLAAES